MDYIVIPDIYEGFSSYMLGKKIFISRDLVKSLGKDTWICLLKEFVGSFTTDRRKGIAIDCLYDEMKSLFPFLLSEDTTNQEDQLLETFEVLRQARKIKKEIKENANNINYQFKGWHLEDNNFG
ncbi:MAG: phage tail tape measure protein family, core region [Herbinix sp.]|jgi:hypothetical protein|nr:phage tail tape measure protein family, core region [Herbinix sp.]